MKDRKDQERWTGDWTWSVPKDKRKPWPPWKIGLFVLAAVGILTVTHFFPLWTLALTGPAFALAVILSGVRL